MSRRKLAALLAATSVAAALAGCATKSLPDPVSSGSSMVVLSFTYRAQILFGTVENAHLSGVTAHIQQMGPSGLVREIASSHNEGNYFFFPNLAPATYRIARIAKAIGGAGHTTTLPSGGTTTTSFRERSFPFEFWPEVVRQTTVNVAPHALVYMGDFTGTLDMPSAPGSVWRVLESGGRRSPEGERAAMEFIARTYPGSAWGSRLSAR